VGRIESEMQRNGEHIEASAIAGIVSPMLAMAEPKAGLRLICIRPRRAARTAASVSRNNMSIAMITPTTDTGNPAPATACSIAGETNLAFPTTAASVPRALRPFGLTRVCR
jgi:hypothetical protein